MDRRKEDSALGGAEEDIARLYGVTRLAIGGATVLAPSLVARIWLGRGAEDAVSKVALRGLGGREAAIGFGTLVALERNAPVRPWLEAGAIADAADAFGAITQRRSMSTARWLLAVGIAAGSAWFATQLASSFED
jgi:hypothetical protein